MSGRYRHLITLQTRTEALDAHGEATLSYSTLGTAWAEVLAVSAREFLENQQIAAEVTHRFTFNHATAYEALTPSGRVVWDGRYFDIVHVIDKMGRARELEITARERI